MKKKEDKVDVMKKPKITTIKLSTKTKSRLNNLKIHKRETYEEILKKMLGILNTCLINPEKARGFLMRIERQKHEIREEMREKK
jgi:hypothetical protein